MTLSSVNEGFVLLRNLWEYNSILKYRYKKRKAYKVATMRHLPAPLAKEYKPNLAVRVLKAIYNNQKLLWSTIFSHFRDGLQGVGSLISGESNDDSWTRQEPRTASSIIRNYKEKYPEQYEKLMNIQIDKPKQLDFKFKVGALVRCCKGTMYSLLKDRVYVVKRSWDGGINGNMVDLEDAKDSLERWSLFEKDLELYVESKQEVRERKLTNVRYVGDEGSHYAFTKGKVYQVEYYRKHDDDSEYIKVRGDVSPSGINPLWCFSLYGRGGAPNDIERFELIYDNENN